MTYRLYFEGRVIGKGRPRAARRGPAKIQLYTPARTAQEERRIKAGMARAYPGIAADGAAYRLTVEVRTVWRARHKRLTMPEHPLRRPDLDNVVKLIADALTGVFWADDAQIVELTARRVWSSQEGVLLEIDRLDDSYW